MFDPSWSSLFQSCSMFQVIIRKVQPLNSLIGAPPPYGWIKCNTDGAAKRAAEHDGGGGPLGT